VDDATAAAADGIVVATDAILDHIGYKNKDGSGQLATSIRTAVLTRARRATGHAQAATA
jgi:hypothetical protein